MGVRSIPAAFLVAFISWIGALIGGIVVVSIVCAVLGGIPDDGHGLQSFSQTMSLACAKAGQAATHTHGGGGRAALAIPIILAFPYAAIAAIYGLLAGALAQKMNAHYGWVIGFSVLWCLTFLLDISNASMAFMDYLGQYRYDRTASNLSGMTALSMLAAWVAVPASVYMTFKAVNADMSPPQSRYGSNW